MASIREVLQGLQEGTPPPVVLASLEQLNELLLRSGGGSGAGSLRISSIVPALCRLLASDAGSGVEVSMWDENEGGRGWAPRHGWHPSGLPACRACERILHAALLRVSRGVGCAGAEAVPRGWFDKLRVWLAGEAHFRARSGWLAAALALIPPCLSRAVGSHGAMRPQW